jgi:hypothetical protein
MRLLDLKITVDSIGIEDVSLLQLGSQFQMGPNDPGSPSASPIRVFDTKTIRPESENTSGLLFPKKAHVSGLKTSKKS